MNKDPENCPFCEAELKGTSSGWGMSPEAWEESKKNHDKYHINYEQEKIKRNLSSL